MASEILHYASGFLEEFAHFLGSEPMRWVLGCILILVTLKAFIKIAKF